MAPSGRDFNIGRRRACVVGEPLSDCAPFYDCRVTVATYTKKNTRKKDKKRKGTSLVLKRPFLSNTRWNGLVAVLGALIGFWQPCKKVPSSVAVEDV